MGIHRNAVIMIALPAVVGICVLFISQTPEDDIDPMKGVAEDHHQCPVHGGDLVIEQVNAWHGRFSPHATKEWWERAAEARRMFPHAMPFPAQADDPDVKMVSRRYCPECREAYERHMKANDGETASDKPETSSNR